MFWNHISMYFRQLNHAGRAVFKENVYLQKALAYHLKEADALQKNSQKLQDTQTFLLHQKVPTPFGLSGFFVCLLVCLFKDWVGKYEELSVIMIHEDFGTIFILSG